jgi:hypothetical protein
MLTGFSIMTAAAGLTFGTGLLVVFVLFMGFFFGGDFVAIALSSPG